MTQHTVMTKLIAKIPTVIPISNTANDHYEASTCLHCSRKLRLQNNGQKDHIWSYFFSGIRLLY